MVKRYCLAQADINRAGAGHTVSFMAGWWQMMLLLFLLGANDITYADQTTCARDGSACGWTRLLTDSVFGRAPAIRDIAVDHQGNSYLAGDTYPTSGPANQDAALLVKLGTEGQLVWMRLLAVNQSSNNVAYSVSSDRDGELCIAGYTDGAFSRRKAAQVGGFVARYNGEGEQGWVADTKNTIVKVAMDEQKNCIATSLEEISKYNTSGRLLWRHRIEGGAIAVDSDGFVYSTITAGSSKDLVITVLDRNGKEVRRIKPTLGKLLGWREADLRNRVLAVDKQKRIFLQATLTTFDGTGQQSIGAYVAEIDKSGTLKWEYYHGTAGYRWDSYDLGLDDEGNSFLAGRITSLTQPGTIDAFVLSISAGGKLRWAKTLGTAAFDGAGSIATHLSNRYTVAGATEGSLEGNINGVKQWAVPFVHRSQLTEK